jgi:hypothetical protein
MGIFDPLRHAMSKLGGRFDNRSHIVPDTRPPDHWRKQSGESQKAYMEEAVKNWDGSPLVGIDEDLNDPEVMERQDLAQGINTNVTGETNSFTQDSSGSDPNWLKAYPQERNFSTWSNEYSDLSDKGQYSSESQYGDNYNNILQATNRTNELDEYGNPIFIQELDPVTVWGKKGRRRDD